MKRLGLTVAVLAVVAGAQGLVGSAAGQDKPASSAGIEAERSRTAFVHLPVDGEARIDYRAKWQNAVILFKPAADGSGRWEEVARSVNEAKAVPLKAGPYFVTAWSNRAGSAGGDKPWLQTQYQITGTPEGFVVGFNDGREPKFDDASVRFAWQAPGKLSSGAIRPRPGTSGAAPAPAPPAPGGPAPKGPVVVPPGDVEKGAR